MGPITENLWVSFIVKDQQAHFPGLLWSPQTPSPLVGRISGPTFAFVLVTHFAVYSYSHRLVLPQPTNLLPWEQLWHRSGPSCAPDQAPSHLPKALTLFSHLSDRFRDGPLFTAAGVMPAYVFTCVRIVPLDEVYNIHKKRLYLTLEITQSTEPDI